MAYTKNKEIVSRIVHKHDTAANWENAKNFIPMKGEIIVYDIDTTHEHERFKIGDGITLVNDLPFQVDISDFEDYKVKQTVVVDPTANGNALAFIDTISQDEMGKITVTKKNVGKVSTAGTADKLASLTVILTGDVTGTKTIKNGNSISIATDLSETGVTAGAYGTDGKALTHGDTFTVPNFSVDAEGRLTAAANKTFTLPAAVDISGKMDKENPTGTGSFSLNRKADTAIGDSSFAEGYDATASGVASHAEGYLTTASGYSSHAEGMGTIASGYSSHAEGMGTIASSDYSHAEGIGTTASGEDSHAEGESTTANSKSQHVQGEYNILDIENLEGRGTYAHIVGNGTNSKRSNAHTLDWNGNAWFAGDVYVGSTSRTNKDTGSKKLATEEYVGNQITANAPNLTNYKTKQTAVSSPTASGSATAFIDTISQDANGKITVSKKNITAAALGLDRAMSFLGTTTTALTDGATTNPITINRASITAAKGDVVIVSGTDQEFIWTGSAWEEFGNASSHSIKGHTHTVTHKPAGTVSRPTFTGTEATISVTHKPAGSVTISTAAPTSGQTATYTPAGTVSKPTFTGTQATISSSFTPAGTVSKPTFTGSAVTSGASETLVENITTSIANRCFTFTISTGTHTHSVTAAGSVSQPTFTGTAGTATATYTPAGSVSQPTFTGTGRMITGSFAGTSATVSTKYTPAGTISQPTFTGTSATLTTSGSNS